MKEFWTNALQALGLAWWVEVTTESPRCTYYFGPFASEGSAKGSQKGYVEDLEKEGATGIKVAIKRCKPNRLTVSEDNSDTVGRMNPPLFSGPA